MKKKVRIYKAGGQQGKVMNPTAQWMAQIGGQQMMQQPTDEQLIMASLDMLSKGNDKDTVYQSLIQSGVSAQKAAQIFQTIDAYIQQQESSQRQALDQEGLTQEEMMQQSRPMDMSDSYMEDQDMNAIYDEEDAFMEQMMETPQFAEEAVEQTAKNGGQKMSKTKWVNQQVKLAKKQMGGPNKADSTDTGVRENRINSFVGTLQNNSNTAALKEYYSNQFDQMNNAQYDDFDYLPEAQFGGLRPGQQRRMMRRANRMMRNIPIGFAGPYGGVPNQINLMAGTPRSFMPVMPTMFMGPQLANIDVRRTGLFGRPKEYTMNFQTFDPSIMKNYQDLMEQMIRNRQTEAKETVVQQKKEEQEAVRDQNKKEADVATETSTTGGGSSSSGTTTTGGGGSSSSGSGTTAQKDPLMEQYAGTDGDIPANYMETLYPDKTIRPKKEPYWTEASVDYDPKWGNVKSVRLDLIDPNTNKVIKSKRLSGNDRLSWEKGKIRGEYDGYSSLSPEQERAHQKRINEQELLDQTAMLDGWNDMMDYRRTDPTLMAAPQAAMADDAFWQSFLIPGLKGTGPINFFGRGVTKAADDIIFQGTKQLGPGRAALNAGRPMLNAGRPMLNAGQRMLNPPPGYQYAIPFQQGGFVDPDSGLYKFVYGGNEPFMDYFAEDSVNTADPYFKKKGGTKLTQYKTKGEVTDNTQVEILDDAGNVTGTTTLADAENKGLKHRVVSDSNASVDNTGLSKKQMDEYMRQMYSMMQGNYYNQPTYTPGARTGLRALFPGMFRGANRTPIVQNLGSWYKQKGSPYNLETGEAYTGDWINPQLTAIDVKDRNLFGDRIRYEFLTEESPLAKPSDFSSTLKENRKQSRKEARQERRDNSLQTRAPLFTPPGWKGTRRPNRFEQEEFDVYSNDYDRSSAEKEFTVNIPEGAPLDYSYQIGSEDVYTPNTRPMIQNPAIGDITSDYTSALINQNQVFPDLSANIIPNNGQTFEQADLYSGDFVSNYSSEDNWMYPGPRKGETFNSPSYRQRLKNNEYAQRDFIDMDTEGFTGQQRDEYYRSLPIDTQKMLFGRALNQNKYGGLYKANVGMQTPPIAPEDFDFAVSDEELPLITPEQDMLDLEDKTYGEIYGTENDINPLPLKRIEQGVFNLGPLDNVEKTKVGIDTKEKKTKRINLRAALNRAVPSIYAGINLADNWLNPEDTNYLTAGNVYGVDTRPKKRGTFNFQTGETSGKDFSAIGGAYSKYGGALDYREGQDTYMSEKDIREFLANGGEIEFI